MQKTDLCNNSDSIHTSFHGQESGLAKDITEGLKNYLALDETISQDALQSIYFIVQEHLRRYESNLHIEENMRRETYDIIENARASFADLERYKDLQEAANIRSSLTRAGIGLAVLDPQGRASEEEMAKRFKQLQQEAHMRIARTYLNLALCSGHYYDIDRLNSHLEMAGATLDDLAAERNTTAEELSRELKIVADTKAKRRLWRAMEDNAPISTSSQ